jgi:hypothetical protein
MADVGKRGGRARVAVVVLVALVALAARVRLVVATRGLPQFEVPVLDSRYYLTTGAHGPRQPPPSALLHEPGGTRRSRHGGRDGDRDAPPQGWSRSGG